MGTTVLHTADTHIGYSQYHRPERADDFIEAFETVIDAAIERSVDAVVHGGDLFQKSRPDVTSLSAVVTQLQRLKDADIPFLMVVGNHDGTQETQWSEFFETLGIATYLDFGGEDIGNVTFYGLDYTSHGKRPNLTYQFEESEATEHAALVAHGLFEPFPYGDWDLNEIVSESNVSHDAFLLGDDHQHRIARIGDGNAVATYPGSTDRTAADQRDERGYNIVEFHDATDSDSGYVDITHETIDTRTFTYVDIEMEDGDGLDTVQRALNDTSISEGDVVVITLMGKGEYIPSATIGDLDALDPALTVQVNDRREMADDEMEAADVAFVDPDEAIEQRRKDVNLSPAAETLETLARDTAGTPDSLLKDEAESLVGEMVEDGAVEDLVSVEEDDIDGDEPAGEDESGTGRDAGDDDDGPEGGDSGEDGEDDAGDGMGSEDSSEEPESKPANDSAQQSTLGDLA